MRVRLHVPNERTSDDLPKPNRHGIADETPHLVEPDRSTRRCECIGLWERLKHCCLSERNGAILLWMPKPSIAVPETLRSDGRSRPIPFHSSVDARIGGASILPVTRCLQLFRPVPPRPSRAGHANPRHVQWTQGRRGVQFVLGITLTSFDWGK